MASKRTLELNPHHPIVKELKNRASQGAPESSTQVFIRSLSGICADVNRIWSVFSTKQLCLHLDSL